MGAIMELRGVRVSLRAAGFWVFESNSKLYWSFFFFSFFYLKKKMLFSFTKVDCVCARLCICKRVSSNSSRPKFSWASWRRFWCCRYWLIVQFVLWCLVFHGVFSPWILEFFNALVHVLLRAFLILFLVPGRDVPRLTVFYMDVGLMWRLNIR